MPILIRILRDTHNANSLKNKLCSLKCRLPNLLCLIKLAAKKYFTTI